MYTLALVKIDICLFSEEDRLINQQKNLCETSKTDRVCKGGLERLCEWIAIRALVLHLYSTLHIPQGACNIKMCNRISVLLALM